MEFLESVAAGEIKDPTWARAFTIARRRLPVATQAWRLVNYSWNGALDTQDFVRLLGFCDCNPACLLDAAEMRSQIKGAKSEEIQQACGVLGLRLSGLVVAINSTTRRILETKPPPLWKSLFQDWITNIEIGYRFGARVMDLGLEAGALVGFAAQLGHGLLLANDARSYREWTLKAKDQKSSASIETNLFGCEIYQVAALALQQLGFGPDAAMGIATAHTAAKPPYFELTENSIRFQAATQWVQALKLARDYPADPRMRNFFTDCAPPTDKSKRNVVLEVIYTEVAKIRGNGSAWTWHLPKPGYAETEQLLGI